MDVKENLRIVELDIKRRLSKN